MLLSVILSFLQRCGDHPQTEDLTHKPTPQQTTRRRADPLQRRAACCPETQPDARRRTDRRTVWCQLSPLSISRHHSSSCCYGQPTPPWQPTGCKSSVRGRNGKREFVCHAVTFKRWWHVSKSLSVARLSFFVSLLVTFSLFFLSVFTVSSLSSSPVLPLFPSSLKLCPVVTSSSFFLLSLPPST